MLHNEQLLKSEVSFQAYFLKGLLELRIYLEKWAKFEQRYGDNSQGGQHAR